MAVGIRSESSKAVEAVSVLFVSPRLLHKIQSFLRNRLYPFVINNLDRHFITADYAHVFIYLDYYYSRNKIVWVTLSTR